MSRLLPCAVVAALMLLVAGCGSEEGFDQDNIEIPAGFIRTVNAIPDSPTLTVQVGTQSRQRLAFGQASPFNTSLPDLSLPLDVTYAGPNQTTLDLLSDEPLFVTVDEELTVILTGSFDSPQLIRLRNGPPTDIDVQTELQLQFVHAATLTDRPVTLTLLQDGETVFEQTLNFGESSELMPLDGGDYRLEATLNSTGELLWESGNFSLSAGTRGLIMLADYFGPGDSDLRGLSVAEQGTTPFANEQFPAALRVANLTTNTGPINVDVREETFAENVSFQATTDFETVTTGEAGVTITPFGEPTNVLFESGDFNFPTGSFLTLVTAGTDDTNTALLISNDRRRIPTRATLTVTNAALSGDTVDIYVVDAGTSIDDVNPRARIPMIPESGASQTLELTEGSYDLVVTDGATKDVRAGPIGMDLMGGGLYTVYVSDAPGGGEPIELVLADDFTP